jgi:hypothetical protein
MTKAQTDLIADHITEFSLAYIHKANSKRRRTKTKVDGKRNDRR